MKTGAKITVICLMLLVGGCDSDEPETRYTNNTQAAKKKTKEPVPPKLQAGFDEAKKKLKAPLKEIDEKYSEKSKSVKVIEIRKPAEHALEEIRINEFIQYKGINDKYIRTGPGMEYANDDTGELPETEKLYVLEEKNGWIRFRVTEANLGWSAWIRKDLTVKAISDEQAKLQRLHQWVQDGLVEGVFHSVDVEYNEVRMDPAPWSLLPIEQKQVFVTCFSQYFDLKGSTGRVTIRSKYSDEKLASYSVWTGIKIYK